MKRVIGSLVLISMLGGCSSLPSYKPNPNEPLEVRLKGAMNFACKTAFSDINESVSWYRDYGQNAVANARGLRQEMDRLLLDARGNVIDAENPKFVAAVEKFKRHYNNYIDELSVPLSGESAAKCSDSKYCYEVSYEKLKQDYADLQDQLDTISVFSLGSILSSPLIAVFKGYVGAARGKCKDSLVAAMRPEYNEIQNLKF